MKETKLLVLPHRSSLIYNSLFTKLFILQIEILLDAYGIKEVILSFIPVKPIRTSKLSALT